LESGNQIAKFRKDINSVTNLISPPKPDSHTVIYKIKDITDRPQLYNLAHSQTENCSAVLLDHTAGSIRSSV